MLKWVYGAYNIYLLILITHYMCAHGRKGEQGLQYVLRHQHSLSEHFYSLVADFHGAGYRLDIRRKAGCSQVAVRPSHPRRCYVGTRIHGALYPCGYEVARAPGGAKTQKEEIRGQN